MWWILSTYNIYNYSQFLCIQILSFFKRENTIGVFMALSQNTYLQEVFFFNIEHVNINFTTMCWRISLIIIKENQQTPRSFQPCIFGPQPFNISLISSSREQTNSEHMRPGIKKTVMFYIMGCKRAVVFGTTFPLSLYSWRCLPPTTSIFRLLQTLISLFTLSDGDLRNTNSC